MRLPGNIADACMKVSEDDSDFLARVKEKLKDVSLALMGREVSLTPLLDGGIVNEGPVFGFSYESLFHKEDSILSPDWQYAHIQSGSGDLSELCWFFPSVKEDFMGVIAQALVFCDFISYKSERDPKIRKDLEDMVSDEYEEAEFIERMVSEGVWFIRDLIHFRKKGVLRDGELSNFVSDLNAVMDDCFSESFLLKNISMFTPTLFEGNCDYCYRTAVISSEEVFRYKEYRDRLPAGIREKADACIKILDNPFNEGETGTFVDSPLYVSGDIEETGRHVVLILTCEWSPDGTVTMRDVNPFYEEAMKWLDRALPTLRAKYGKAPENDAGFEENRAA